MRIILTVLIVMFSLVGSVSAQNPDINLLQNINLNRNKVFDPSLKFVTNTTIPISVASPFLVYSAGFISKDATLKQKGLFIAESFIGTTIITLAMKYSVNRDRPFVTYPFIDQATSATTSSFPSGHTSSAFSTATSLSLVFPKWYVIAPSFLWAGTVGYSRMSLGVHYPSDVFVGAIIGAGTAFLTYKINSWIRKKREVENLL
jgi:membrane-associated phospholipid phosphatase